VPSSPVGPRTPIPDKETIHYVFRGKRLAFQNPHFGVPNNPRSMLQPEHPDFSPSEDCTPRRLFGPPHKGKSPTKAQPQTPAAPKRSPSPAWEDDGDDDDAFGAPPRATLAREFEKIGRAEGKKLLSPANERKASTKAVTAVKEGTKVTRSGSQSDETLT